MKKAFVLFWEIIQRFLGIALEKRVEKAEYFKSASMLGGMFVILQNLRNHPEMNDMKGHVLFVKDDDRLCVELIMSGKVVSLRAENVRQWASDASIESLSIAHESRPLFLFSKTPAPKRMTRP